MVDYILKYAEGAGRLFHYVDDHADGNKYSVPGLTGCMGIICIPGPASTHVKFFLGHSKSDPHIDLKIKLENYINANGISGSGAIIKARWRVQAGQREWIEKNLKGVNFEYLGESGALTWPGPVDQNDDRIVGISTTMENGKLINFRSPSSAEKKLAYESSNTCKCCKQNFGITRWKYRCKSCNGIMCDSCSANGEPWGRNYTRICTDCNITKGPGKSQNW